MKIFFAVLAGLLTTEIIFLCRTPRAMSSRIKDASRVVKAIWDAIAESPRWRLTVTIIGTILVGILSGLYAIELAPNGVIVWSNWAKVSSFWPLIIVGLAWLLIQISFLRYEEARERVIERFADDVYCRGHWKVIARAPVGSN